MLSVFGCDMEPTLEDVKANLFHRSHAAIDDWIKFPWHRDINGHIQTHKTESSQALAIDVFGTIKVSEERDRILGALAFQCGVPGEGPWTLELEWTDPANLLREPRPTQVDAIAFGKRGFLVIECKFTEGGGGCSQPHKITRGAHRGLRQCNGDYTLQINPVNRQEARCALTGKGVRYWEVIPGAFGLDPEQEYRPCPFKGDAYQWMRNVVLAETLASNRSVSGAMIAAYADGEFATAKKVHAGVLGHAALSGRKLVFSISYQSIVTLAKSVSGHEREWDALSGWIERKIGTVGAQNRPL